MVNNNTVQASGKNTPANLDIKDLPGDNPTDVVSPVTLLDALVVAGCITFAAICVGGVILLNKRKKVSLPSDNN